MRVVNVVELTEFEDFENLAPHDPYTFYYGPISPKAGVAGAQWSSGVTLFGGALKLSANQPPLYFTDNEIIKELVVKQGYLTEAEVRQIVSESSGGGGAMPKKQTLIFETWPTEGPIKNKPITECFVPGSIWGPNSYGSVVRTDGVNSLVGPAMASVKYVNNEHLVSEPLIFKLMVRSLSNQAATVDEPFITFQPSSTGGRIITIYGDAETGAIKVSVNCFHGTISSEKIETFQLPIHAENVEFTIIITLDGVQVSAAGQYCAVTGFAMPSFPSVDGFSVYINSDAKIGEIIARRIAYVNAV